MLLLDGAMKTSVMTEAACIAGVWIDKRLPIFPTLDSRTSGNLQTGVLTGIKTHALFRLNL
jgi:hypothetical protein